MRLLGKFSALFLLAFSLQWLGALCNHIVVAANNGHMPVIVLDEQTEKILQLTDEHIPLTRQTKYWVLSDVFPIVILYGFPFGVQREIWSIGDALLYGGGLIFVVLPFLPFCWVVRWLVKKMFVDKRYEAFKKFYREVEHEKSV